MSASRDAPALLEARGALTHFGLTQPVSFIERGSGVLGILGPNGAGKSTLLRALCGLLSLKSGAILTRGQAVHTLDSAVRVGRVAYLPQSPPLSPLWTAREVVEQALIPQQSDLEGAREELTWLCDQLEIATLLERPICELSGGELRRVTVARALAQRAELSLLDEPLSALDWSTQERLMGVFNLVAARRGALIIASIHELNLASLYTQRALMLCRGEVVAYGGTREVLTREHIAQAYGADPLLIAHPNAQRNDDSVDSTPDSALDSALDSVLDSALDSVPIQMLPWGPSARS